MAIAEKQYLNPYKLTDGLITAFYNALLRVHTYTAAVTLCDISLPTLFRWLEIAKQDEIDGKTPETSMYLKLLQAINQAKAENEERMLNVIKSTAEEGKNWLPAAWFLERTNPDEFGRRDRHDVNLNENKNIRITRVTIVAPEQIPQETIIGQYNEIQDNATDVAITDSANMEE